MGSYKASRKYKASQQTINEVKRLLARNENLEPEPLHGAPIIRENKLTPEKTSVAFMRGQPMAIAGEYIRGTIVHIYKQRADSKQTIAILDTGHRLHFSLRMLNLICPMVGSVIETYYGFPRENTAYGKHYVVSSRWVKLSAL